jgi:glycine betaine/proline transport system permease protein
VPAWLVHVPVTNTVFEAAADSIDAALETLYRLGGRGFDGVRDLIRAIVHALEAGLVETPWPVVMGVIVLVAWRVAGRRVALFTCGAIGYLALMGLWSLAMQTVALLGAAAMICVGLGVPLGIWCARSARVYASAAGPDADDAVPRLPDPGHRLLRHGHSAGDHRHHRVRDAAGGAPHRTRPSERARRPA